MKTIAASTLGELNDIMNVKCSAQCLAHSNWQVVLLLSALNIIIPVRSFGIGLCLRALGLLDLPSFQALPNEGDIIQGAAALGTPLLSGVRRAGLVVGPGGQDRVD